jgi:glycosyltransferase involved in cell wall biosynthesis
VSKIKVLTISDHPLSPSGVGTQTRYVIEALLKTGNFQFNSLAGAMHHDNYTPVKTEEWKDDWVIYPIDGYGDPDTIRSLLRTYKPDIVWFMTDPRFYIWLWEMEDEVRSMVPLVYYHVWDNYPYPTFNQHYYDSCDVIATISKVTDDIVKTVSPDTESVYIPHAVDSEIFKPLEKDVIQKARLDAGIKPEQTLFFWNNRNARRKQSGSLIFWFKDFLEKVGDTSAMLIMHTSPKDEAGQDLEAIVHQTGLVNGQIKFSTVKIPPHQLAMMYNMADCTVNIADAEGFGLSSLESLSCGTPVINTMTGGLQEQVTDGENWFGIGIEPASRAIIGSQQIPWIYEDRLSGDDVVAAFIKMHEMSDEERTTLGAAGREHTLKNYNFETFNKQWISLMTDTYEKRGSWENRKMYNRWELIKMGDK